MEHLETTDTYFIRSRSASSDGAVNVFVIICFLLLGAGNICICISTYMCTFGHKQFSCIYFLMPLLTYAHI